MITHPKCKICRRAGTKLFLKGERCLSSKCSFLKRSYPPGFQGNREGRKYLSEYGRQLREKQKLRNWYNLGERRFKRYVKEVLGKRGQIEDTQDLLIKRLEKRLDNVVFRLGFASSRSEARRLVSHAHFLVNERKVNIPSYNVRKGDRISLRPSSREKSGFRKLKAKFEKYQTPSWLRLNIEKLEGTVVENPTIDEVSPPAEISSIFEFYSR